MKSLPASFEIRVMLFAKAPMEALAALDAPGIAVCDVVRNARQLPDRASKLCPHALALLDPIDSETMNDIIRALALRPPRIIQSSQARGLAEAVRRSMLTSCPALALPSMPRREELARQTLREIGMSPSLLGAACIARGAALLSACPKPAPPLQYHLYPLLAQEMDVSAASVEKRVRSAIESAWLHGDLAAQNRLLGLSVSAERGKPTNSELLHRLSDRICELL
ncbi:MAG: sporulation initiation factor Spo0A C-terminal domain-containing protein [Clostridia bacterium]|nr:sporulation initiation factor Spo0A C-terminal domain-containing protein [Clostridia bacterium]